MIFYIILWLLFGYIVAKMGESRTIGFAMTFLISIFLSPVVGLIVVLLSDTNDEVEERELTYQKQIRQIHEQQKQNEALTNKIIEAKAPVMNTSLAEELQRLKQLKDDGVLTDEEFQTLKQKLLS